MASGADIGDTNGAPSLRPRLPGNIANIVLLMKDQGGSMSSELLMDSHSCTAMQFACLEDFPE